MNQINNNLLNLNLIATWIAIHIVLSLVPITLFAQQSPQPQSLLIKVRGEKAGSRSSSTDILKNYGLEKTFHSNREENFANWTPTSRTNDIQRIATQIKAANPTWEVEPDYYYQLTVQPDDPLYEAQSNLMAIGTSCLAGIDASQAWEEQTGNAQTVIVIIDGGMDLKHEDLKANLWKNPGEMGLDSLGQDKSTNGIDDDGNGYVDDVNGWDFANNDNSPQDDNGHGTHVAGIIGARGNNGLGISGICWNSKVMPLKFTDEQGFGSTSDAIRAIDYAIDMKRRGANILVINNSWGGGDNSTFLREAIQRANKAGILFVAAAGNDGLNNDQYAFYPASYELENIISVGALDCQANLASFSNYGQVSVDITAPGDAILSTLPNNTYGNLSGTSMAAPHITGGIGLLQTVAEDYSHLEIKNAILNSAFPVSGLNGKIVSGGNFHLANALSFNPDLWGSQYLFGSKITTMTEDDSLLWVGTNGGLLRLDLATKEHLHYTNANSGLPNNYITCMVKDQQGNLWTGTKDGLANFTSNGWQQFAPKHPRLPNFHVSALALQGDTVLWVGTRKGWVNRYHIPSQRWGAAKNLGRITIKSLFIAPTPTGNDALYITTSDSILVRGLARRGTQTLLRTKIIEAMSDGKRLWVAGKVGEKIQVRSINFQNANVQNHPILNRTLNDSLPTGIITRMAVSQQGTFWAGDKFGNITKYNFADRDLQLFKRTNLRPLNAITAMSPTTGDSIWTGNINGETALFNGEKWEIVDLPLNNLPRGRIKALETSSDSVLMGTANGLMKYKAGIFNILGLQEGRDNISTIKVDNDGDIWIGTTQGLLTNMGGNWRIFNSDSSALPNNNVRAIETDDKRIWVGTYGGITRFDKELQSWELFSTCCVSDSILTLKLGRNGKLWIGTSRGLSKYQNGTFEHGITKEIAGEQKVSSLAIDTLAQRLWIGSDRGLIQLDQKNDGSLDYTLYTVNNSGLPNNSITSVVTDELNRVWTGTPKGIARYDGRRWEVYNTTNSILPNDEVLSLAATKNEGIWAGTAGGLGIIVPPDLIGFNISESIVCVGEEVLFESRGILGDSLQWKVNDSIVSRLTDVSYVFDHPGEYQISLVVSIDTVSFTDSGFVTVRQPLDISLPADTATLAPSISLNVEVDTDATFLWTNQEEDTLGYTSQLTITESGTYFLQAEDECGTSQVDSIEVSLLGDGEYVLPGDAIPDGQINLSDWLLINLLDGNTGFSRTDTSDVWEPKFSPDWLTSFQSDLASSLKDSLINYKHADIDGNGLIDSHIDGNLVNAYVNNTAFSVHPSSPTDSNGLNLSLEVLNKQAFANSTQHTLVFDFYLEGDTTLLNNVHSLAFRLNTGTITDSAWTQGFDTHQNHNSLTKRRTTYTDMGFGNLETVEFIGQNQPSLKKGKIGNGNIIIIIENIDTNRVSLSNYQVDLNLSISDILILDTDGNYLPVNEISAQQIETVTIDLQPIATFVDIDNFQATCDAGSLKLSWEAWEQDAASYIVEQMEEDGTSYLVIDSLSVNHSHTQNPKSYAINVPANISAWYRLKIVSIQGEIAYTDSIFARSCLPANQQTYLSSIQSSHLLSLYPNPTIGKLWFEMSYPEETEATLELFNLNGMLRMSHIYKVSPIKKRFLTDLRALPAGIYFARIVINHQTIMQKTIILQE